MIGRSVFLASCLSAFACSTSLQSGNDAAAGAGGGGTAGAGQAGTAGATGNVGQGGAGGVAACVSPSAGVAVFTLGDDGNMPRESSTSSVNVVSVDDCTTGVCAPTATSGMRVVVSDAAGKRWTLYVYFLGLPVDFVSVGEALDLRLVFRDLPTPFYDYHFFTTILSRAGTAVVFDASAASDLTDYGITVTSNSNLRCGDSFYITDGATVTYAGETREVPPMQTVRIGKLSFVLRGFSTAIGGDGPSHTESMAGFIDR